MLHSPYECMGVGLFVLLWADEEKPVFSYQEERPYSMKALQSLPTYIEVKGWGALLFAYTMTTS